MIYFIYGEDSYRAKRKLEEIISGYKKVHKSGLNLIYIDAGKQNFKDFYSNLKITSMFAEKKIIILNNVFSDAKFQEDFLENIKNLEDTKDIIVIYEDELPDKRTKFFKALQKNAKCQEFNYLQPAMLRKWVAQEFEKNKAKINPDALDLLASFVSSDLWKMANEINKLSNYKAGSVIRKEDVELLVKPNIENDIFKTIDALASKDKKLALFLLHKHLDNGEAPLRLLSMISYQFRNLLMIKELQDMQKPYGLMAKQTGLHPFVVQKSYYLCNQFSMPKLKKIYLKIFQVDSDIKTGKIEPETALYLLLAEI
jgi:DNA polymerase III subunit delta